MILLKGVQRKCQNSTWCLLTSDFRLRFTPKPRKQQNKKNRIQYSFNCNTEDDNVEYNQCLDTDYYRLDNPYKLLCTRGDSFVGTLASFIRFHFGIPANDKGYFLTSAKFKVNHCQIVVQHQMER